MGIGPVDLTVEVGGLLDEAMLEKLAVATERYCVVGQSLAVPPRITVRRR